MPQSHNRQKPERQLGPRDLARMRKFPHFVFDNRLLESDEQLCLCNGSFPPYASASTKSDNQVDDKTRSR